ncbi:hypothetical protein [Natrinema pallidum]|uniref:Uncharacterized protein n=1 Tax=Natrinema pallidum TaxID=69527 RepID=A0A4P9TJX6_9EURY|nr:hypothetical protein [Natrinema pallidum]QCW05279.1 hypothetical protein FGF80_18725 [Natrinema pallidum]
MSTEPTLGPGTLVKTGDDEYQAVDDPALGTVLTEIGDREIGPEQVPGIGDDCLRPDCDGHVEDVNGRRWCSEGCLEWFRTTPQDGDPCDKYGDRCDGTLRETGDLEWECDTCDRFRSSARVTWREAWLPNADRGGDE